MFYPAGAWNAPILPAQDKKIVSYLFNPAGAWNAPILPAQDKKIVSYLFYPTGAWNAPILPALKERILPLPGIFMHGSDPVHFLHDKRIEAL